MEGFEFSILLIKICVFIVAALFFLYNKEFILYALKRIIEILLLPTGALKRTNKLKIDKQKAFYAERSLSDLVLYRKYLKKPEDRYGIYTFANYRKGFILEVSPGPYLGAKVEEAVQGLIADIDENNVSIQFLTFSSENIESMLQNLDYMHNKQKPINIDNFQAIDKLMESKKKYFRKWTKETMMSSQDQSDFRVRNFVNLILVTVKETLSKDKLDHLYNSVYSSMVDIKPREFSGNQLVEMLQEIYNPDRTFFGADDIEMLPMNKIICSGAKMSLTKEKDINKDKFTLDDLLESDGTFRLGSNYVRVFTTESFPKDISLSSYQAALFNPLGKDHQIPIPCKFLASYTIVFDDVKKNTNKSIQKAKWNIGSLAYIPTTVEEKNPNLRERREEYRNFLKFAENENGKVISANSTHIIMDKNIKVVDASSGALVKRFEDNNWRLRAESFPQVAAGQLINATQYSSVYKNASHRFAGQYTANTGKITPLLSDFKGYGDPIMLAVGRTGQFITFGLRSSDITSSSFILVGPPGKGKSVFLNEFIASEMKAGSVIRSIDLGDSQRDTVEFSGGQYESFDEDNIKCLNFFTNIKTKIEETIENGVVITTEVIDPDELETIVPMVGRMAGIKLTASHLLDKNVKDSLQFKHAITFIERALELAFTANKRNAGMQDVYNALLQLVDVYKDENAQFAENLAIALEDYAKVRMKNGTVKVGKYYRYFNGANNLELKKDYFMLELLGVNSKSKDFSSVVLMGILHKMAEEAYDRLDRFKWYLIDEAKEPLADPLFSHFLDNFTLRIRKYNGGVGVVTQSVRHFFVNNEAIGVYDNSNFKIFLEQDNASIDYLNNTGKVVLNTFVLELMKSIKTRKGEFSEAMIMAGDQVMIVRIKLDPFSKWLYTSDPADKATIIQIMNDFSLPRLEAIEYLANLTDNPRISHEENLNQIALGRKVI